jgi:hypothetical protein
VTLQEWTAQIIAELKAAGFDAAEHEGFPLMKMPETHFAIVRLLKLRLSLATDRRIYAEGMLFVPTGAWEKAAELERAKEVPA